MSAEGENMSKMTGRAFRTWLFGEDAVSANAVGASAQLAPWLGEITDRALFEDIWQGGVLPTRDRSLVTIAALAALGRHRELRAHVRAARGLGIADDELIHAIVQLTFYVGLPPVHAALEVVRDVITDGPGEQV